MSLEQKIEALTVAVQALTAWMQSGGQTSAPVAAPTVGFTPPASTVGAPLPNGMPGGPFGATAAPTFAPPPAAPGAPFSDLNGCTKYAVDTHGLLEAKAPGRGEVVTQLIQHLCGSNSINDLPVAAYPMFYAELEKQKVA